ncbi:hypothetical protein GA0074692_0022 [Micromonospora pallida]|uniref:Uncharacterized protein n=1 Tax=Micromonospora pallida TaxID=145854 RepID=A0A1C6RGW0_9ACTN|nr:hypothetical protein [Micromonospora pallida]SCL16407.1 hypothetical protein GA0074692_0022 [Micromonospora pallida]
MTPYHLHATANAWSLRKAHTHLAQLADDEAKQIAAEQLEAPEALRSPSWGRRHALGGHGDPTPDMVATADRMPRINRWKVLLDRADRRIAGLAVMTRLAADTDPLGRLIAGIPALLPGTAAIVARHLADEDAWIRNAVGLYAERSLVPGEPPCPVCQVRRLEVQTAGPVEVWTVVCAEQCLCTGQGCRCGLDGAVEGVAHIWPRAAVLAVARKADRKGQVLNAI